MIEFPTFCQRVKSKTNNSQFKHTIMLNQETKCSSQERTMIANNETPLATTMLQSKIFLVLVQIAMLSATIWLGIDCEFDAINSIMTLCVAAYFYVVTTLKIIKYENDTPIDSIASSMLITTLLVIIGLYM